MFRAWFSRAALSEAAVFFDIWLKRTQPTAIAFPGPPCVAAANITSSRQGPPVGDKTPSTAITAEYAKADEIYVQKTLVGAQGGHEMIGYVCSLRLLSLQALPETYSHYRPIHGDGNCGWRG